MTTTRPVKDKIATFRNWNKDLLVKSKCRTLSRLWGKDDTDTDFLLTLQEIAKDNGGLFKHVTEEGLQK